jgi:hypothetical protein
MAGRKVPALRLPAGGGRAINEICEVNIGATAFCGKPALRKVGQARAFKADETWMCAECRVKFEMNRKE